MPKVLKGRISNTRSDVFAVVVVVLHCQALHEQIKIGPRYKANCTWACLEGLEAVKEFYYWYIIICIATM